MSFLEFCCMCICILGEGFFIGTVVPCSKDAVVDTVFESFFPFSQIESTYLQRST